MNEDFIMFRTSSSTRIYRSFLFITLGRSRFQILSRSVEFPFERQNPDTRFTSSLSFAGNSPVKVPNIKKVHEHEFFFMIQFADAERSYRSDCETDDGISVANDNEFLSSSQHLTAQLKNRSPMALRQSSPFPNEMTNRRMQQYNSAQERLRNGELKT